jgi:hypothetical protein
MKEAPEKGKELSHSAHGNGMRINNINKDIVIRQQHISIK